LTLYLFIVFSLS